MNNDPIKVIFLDIDGVLNSEKSINKNLKKFGKEKGQHALMPDRSHIKLLNHIIKETNCKIVLSSSWRILSFYHHIDK